MEETTSNGGWCAPSDDIFFVEREIAEQMGLEVPRVTATRGGIDWNDTTRVERKPPVTVEHDPRGHWEYAVDTADYEDGDTEPDIVSGWGSSWGEPERFITAEQAEEFHPGGKVYKRWVPAPGPWDEA